MKKNEFISLVLVSIVTALGLVSFTLCIAAEFKKPKKKDLRLDGKSCYLPGSVAYRLGIAALICFSMGQVMGNLLICRKLFSSYKANKKSTINGFICAFSWISYGMAVILIGAATSMSKTQPYGEGWVDGECYIVKNGVYSVSAILVLLTLSLTLASTILEIRKNNQVEQDRKVLHQQV